jgi:hypothetical protein
VGRWARRLDTLLDSRTCIPAFASEVLLVGLTPAFALAASVAATAFSAAVRVPAALECSPPPALGCSPLRALTLK